ncbi:MAG TPA: hypothetical protein VK014_16030 [Cyclobacteriaceae bacterium]|nr:hypothetical protein [Cyclobacteriaceae bacterium]
MINIRLLPHILTLLLISCVDDSPATKLVDVEGFSIVVPADWDSFRGRGYDSKVGVITDGRNILTYDYGWYSSDFKNETAESHVRMVTTIDGKPAHIVMPIEKGKGIIGVYIEVGGPMRFNLMGRDIKDEETVINIFKSIRFHDN